MAAPETPEPGVTVTLREIYDRLGAVDAKVSDVHSDVRVLRAQMDDARERVADHDAAISSLDKWRYGLPIAAAPGLGAMIMSLLKSTGVA